MDVGDFAGFRGESFDAESEGQAGGLLAVEGVGIDETGPVRFDPGLREKVTADFQFPLAFDSLLADVAVSVVEIESSVAPS